MMKISNTSTKDMTLLVGNIISPGPEYTVELKAGESHGFDEDSFDKVAFTDLKEGEMVSAGKIIKKPSLKTKKEMI